MGTKVEATDVDDITLTYSLSGAPDFVIDATGQIQVALRVTLDRERTLSYDATVTAADGKGGTDSITINVSNVNERLTAINDAAMTDEDQSVKIDVLANDTDPDTERAALRVSVLTQPLNGRARVEADKTITYTPNANYHGPPSDPFTYTVSNGSLSADGSVTVTVVSMNDAPTFPSPTAARSVPEDAEADDNVGAPVTAMDVESALLTYRRSGADAGSFDIDGDGQIAVAPPRARSTSSGPSTATSRSSTAATTGPPACGRTARRCGSLTTRTAGAKRLFAYRLPAPEGPAPEGPAAEDAEPQDLERVRDNVPDPIDARLASLTLSGVDIGEFDPGRTDYEGAVAEGVTETTVEAEAMQRRTDVAIDPPDADVEANGHQVALQDLGEITVTSADGSRKKTYRVQFPETGWDPARDPWPHCLRGAVAVGFSLVVYAGGSIEDLVACAEGRNVTALYALEGGEWVSYIVGAPELVNRSFAGLFAEGLAALTPLIARSDGPASTDPSGDAPRAGDATQPWPACLQGGCSDRSRTRPVIGLKPGHSGAWAHPCDGGSRTRVGGRDARSAGRIRAAAQGARGGPEPAPGGARDGTRARHGAAIPRDAGAGATAAAADADAAGPRTGAAAPRRTA